MAHVCSRLELMAYYAISSDVIVCSATKLHLDNDPGRVYVGVIAAT